MWLIKPTGIPAADPQWGCSSSQDRGPYLSATWSPRICEQSGPNSMDSWPSLQRHLTKILVLPVLSRHSKGNRSQISWLQGELHFRTFSVPPICTQGDKPHFLHLSQGWNNTVHPLLDCIPGWQPSFSPTMLAMTGPTVFGT